MAKKKYSYNEKKAYYIGYGMGLVSNSPSDDVVDTRMGKGQHVNLCNSAKKGFHDGKKNRKAVAFEKGYKKYPVSIEQYLKK